MLWTRLRHHPLVPYLTTVLTAMAGNSPLDNLRPRGKLCQIDAMHKESIQHPFFRVQCCEQEGIGIYLSYAITWTICRERNRRIFEDRPNHSPAGIGYSEWEECGLMSIYFYLGGNHEDSRWLSVSLKHTLIATLYLFFTEYNVFATTKKRTKERGGVLVSSQLT